MGYLQLLCNDAIEKKGPVRRGDAGGGVEDHRHGVTVQGHRLALETPQL